MRTPFSQILPWTLFTKQRNILDSKTYFGMGAFNKVDKRSVYWEIRIRLKKEQN
jgi:hypothetical protein